MHFTTLIPALLSLSSLVLARPQGIFERQTSSVPRTKPGRVTWGPGEVYSCVNAGTVAMTFDDGPYVYTNEMLDTLARAGAKATFFVTGNNIGKGAIDDPRLPWGGIIQRMDREGHQIASHTWSHQDLSNLGDGARKQEMYRLEEALKTLIGKFPTYMRPPYSSCTGGCRDTMSKLGYHIIYFDLDTDDYNQLGSIGVAKDNVARAVAQNRDHYLSIAHDIHKVTVQELLPYMIQTFQENNIRMVTLGECLGDPVANWYRS